MTKQIFNIGEIVHLNSGSPDLKVVRIDADQVRRFRSPASSTTCGLLSSGCVKYILPQENGYSKMRRGGKWRTMSMLDLSHGEKGDFAWRHSGRGY